MVGGMVLLAVGGTAAAIKLSHKDAQKIEEHTGASVEEMSEEELVAAMKDLGIQSIELDDDDKAALAAETGETAPSGTQQPQPAPSAPYAAPAAEESYLAELEKLGALRDQGIITEEEFAAKKKQLLGI
jgi:hypothetical protein